MSTFGERLKELRKEKRLTQKQLAQILFIDDTSISKYENGKNGPENVILNQIADYFEVSTDYLLGRDENLFNGVGGKLPALESKLETQLTDKDTKDIEKALNKTLESLEQQDGLMLSGSPVDEDDWELLKAAIQNGLEYAKKMNKQKYTPKKYRK